MHIHKGWKRVAISAALAGAIALVPMGASAHTIDQPLQKGANGKDVKPVQKQLKNEDYYKGQVDGVYGKNTKKAVTHYQKDHALASDGIYGTNTSNAMDQGKKHTYKKLNNTSLLQQGSKSKAVKTLQSELQDLHYYHGNIDSIFGPQTASATKAFQKASNIAVDGIVGPDTKKALENHPVSADASSNNKATKQTKKKTSANNQAKKSSNSHKTKAHHNKASKQTQPKSSTNHQTQNKHVNKVKAASTSKASSGPSSNNSGKSISVEATAYTAHCTGCSGVTSQGINLKKNPNKKVIAVDPSVIKPGSTVQVPGYGKAVAGDTGGDIKGHRIDIFKSDEGDANSYGRKNITVKVLD